jgi:glycosyltransferase involved in cell wall biosynthesis
MTETEFTIVMPVYKRTTYFRQALDSALAQNVEVKIVVHDASPADAGFRELIGNDAGRVKYYHFPNSMGIGGDWNRALGLAESEWFSLLHQDDWLDPNFCGTFLADLEKYPSFGFWLCGTHEVAEGTIRQTMQVPNLWTRDKLDISRLLLLESLSRCAGVVLNQKTMENVRGFDIRMKHSVDIDLFIRAALAGGACFNSKVLAYYRIHPESTTGISTVNKRGKTVRLAILDDHRLLQDHMIFMMKQPKENLENENFRIYSSKLIWGAFRYYLKRARIRSLLYWIGCWRCHIYRFVFKLKFETGRRTEAIEHHSRDEAEP